MEPSSGTLFGTSFVGLLSGTLFETSFVWDPLLNLSCVELFSDTLFGTSLLVEFLSGSLFFLETSLIELLSVTLLELSV